MTKLRVPYARSFSLTRNFTLSSDVVVVTSSLSRTAHCFSRTPKLCTECSSFCFFSFLPLSINTLAQTLFSPLLFCLIVYVLLDFILRLCLWRLKKRGCQITCCKITKLVSITDRSFQLPLSLLLMSSNSVVTVTHLKVVETAAAAAAGISPFFLPRNTRDHLTTGDPRFSFLPAGVTHGFSPLGARARSFELELVVALVASGRTRFFAEKHRHSL